MQQKSVRNILLVVDPTRQKHPTLERAFAASDIDHALVSNVTVAVLVDHDNVDTDADNPLMHVDGDRLLNLKRELEERNIQHKFIFSWSHQWTRTIELVAAQNQCDMISLPFYNEQARGKYLLNNETWALLRSSTTPVALCKENTKTGVYKTILASLRLTDDSYTELNRTTFEAARILQQRGGGDIHVVAAYNDSMDYPDRGRIVNLASLPNSNVHIRQGDPAEVIADVAKRIGADVVVIGNRRRTGFRAALRGNTVERIVSQVDSDVVMVL